MKLIWTYNNTSKSLSDRDRLILINYYISSIYSAKKLDYETIMYCSLEEQNFWLEYCDEVIPVTNQFYLDSPLWDSFKIFVIENRDDEYCLIDGDLILHNRLPKFTEQIIFDSYEILNWETEYKPTITTLTELCIGDEIYLWGDERVPVMSCGILHIKDKNISEMYVNVWKMFNQFIIRNKFKVDTYRATAVGAQYLLSVIVHKMKLSTQKLCESFGKKCEYYIHHFGDQKYKNPIVPTDNFIEINTKSKLF